MSAVTGLLLLALVSLWHQASCQTFSLTFGVSDSPDYNTRTSSGQVDEGGSVRICFKPFEVPTERPEFRVRTKDGSARAPGDYTALDATLPFTEDETQCVWVYLNLDSEDEGDETFEIEAKGVFGDYDDLDIDVTVTITNQAMQGLSFSIEHDYYPVAESSGQVTVCVAYYGTQPLASTVTVTLQTDDSPVFPGQSPASVGSDYTPESDNLMFPAGSTAGTRRCIAIEIITDNTDENEETIQLQLTTQSRATLGPLTSATVRITETDTVIPDGAEGCDVRTDMCDTNASCTITSGSYECTCNMGYSGNGFTCDDVDECAIGTDMCDKNAYCMNSSGSYDCTCNNSFTGDGFNCIRMMDILSDSGPLSTGIIAAIAVPTFFFVTLISFTIIIIIGAICVKQRRVQHKNRYPVGKELLEQRGGGLNTCAEENSDHEKLVRKVIPQKSIRLLNFIGEGEFGLVYKAHLVTVATQTVAVKTLKGFHDQEKTNALLDEARHMVNLDHPNILTLIGVCMDEHSTPCIVMPYMANGSLLVHLRRANNYVLVNSHEQRLVQDISRRLLSWCLQIAQGMEYLAVKRIVHRDLAARNCMLGENMAIKIADFGFSEKLYTKAYIRMVIDGTVKLPVKWMAPESICHEIFSEKSDVWSFGVTCWEIFTGGVTPYPGVHSSAIPRMRDHERIMDRPDNQACSEDMYGVMLDCWESAADDRPSFSQLVTVLTTHLETLAGGYLKIIAV